LKSPTLVQMFDQIKWQDESINLPFNSGRPQGNTPFITSNARIYSPV
jgi:hypothetical protein